VPTTRGPEIVRVAGLLLAVAAVGWLDYVTGADLSFALFYLIPIAAAGLWVSRGPAVAVALAASAAWAAADIAWRGVAPVVLWNAFTRLGIFVGAAVVLARLREDRRQLVAPRDQLRVRLAREEQLARTDPVTELPNARAFYEALDRALERTRRGEQPLALAYLDLDDFKAVNDRLGHAEGDRVLRQVGRAIDGAIREGDVAARLGGDEFAVLVEDGGGLAEALQVAGRVQRAVRLPFVVAGREIVLGASLGLASSAGAGETAGDLLRDADVAMYQAKRAG
jgi:diguanylate cyclase (GGDEF)-like protein